jgi:hypothetical protein
MMRLPYLNWRLHMGGFFHTRVWFCDECWEKLSKCAHPVQETTCFVDGKFVLQADTGVSVLVSFSSKGGDGVSDDTPCGFCGRELPGWGEEVNLSIDL